MLLRAVSRLSSSRSMPITDPPGPDSLRDPHGDRSVPKADIQDKETSGRNNLAR